MSLDLNKTVNQLRSLTDQLRMRQAKRVQALSKAQTLIQDASPDRLERMRLAGRSTWMAAGLNDQFAEIFPPSPLPEEYAVIAVDGSHIDVDRHFSARCSLINTGHVYLKYGETGEASLWNEPILNSSDEDLVLTDPIGLRDQPIEGHLLGIKRAVQEVKALADMVEDVPDHLPILGLLDGSLILWGLSGQQYPDFVREELLENGLFVALDKLKDAAKTRLLAVASYISFPRSTDVIKTLRHQACPFETIICDQHCHGLRNGNRPCDVVSEITDRELFELRLGYGERSPMFRSLSSIVDEYREHRVHFCYLNVGEEIARVEMPAWVAMSNDATSFAQAAIVSQARKGHGYPVALSEAHEQAVVTGQDREQFRLLIEESMELDHQHISISQKDRSKRTRYL